MEIDVSWEPTSRGEIITQDIRDGIGRYLGGRPDLGMSVDGSKRVPVGGEGALALHGSFRGGSEGVGASSGFWTWVMLVEGERAYLFRLWADDSGGREGALTNLEGLESLLTTVEFH